MAKSQDSTRYRGKRMKRSHDDASRAKVETPAVEQSDDTAVAVENHEAPREPVPAVDDVAASESRAATEIREAEHISGLDAETHPSLRESWIEKQYLIC